MPGSFHERALRAAAAGLEHANGLGVRVGVVVIDVRGGVAAAVSADRAYPSVFDVARAKARTALNFGAATGDLAERVQPPSQQALAAVVPGLMFVAGGVPLREGEALVGAVGVSGASAAEDAECAARAAAAF